APYVPGWDCHGLPIELQVEKSLGKEKKAALSKLDIRRLCRDYATRFVAVQRDEFKRLGVFGDWAAPYLTMDFAYEATEVRELAGTPIDVAIWPTTPWTLPANLAIAAHPHVEYVVVPARSGRLTLLAKALLPRLGAFIDPDAPVKATITGRELEGARARHPWI